MTPAHAQAQTPSHNAAYTPSHSGHREEEHSARQNGGGGDGGDPFYFIIENALLTYQGRRVVVRYVDRQNSVCALAKENEPGRVTQSNVPLHHNEHSVASDLASAKVRVVYGKLKGEVGSLIGIDNEEAVVQLSSTTEVTIIAKKCVVIYVDAET